MCGLIFGSVFAAGEKHLGSFFFVIFSTISCWISLWLSFSGELSSNLWRFSLSEDETRLQRLANKEEKVVSMIRMVVYLSIYDLMRKNAWISNPVIIMPVRFTETLGLQSPISLVERLLFSTMPLQGASNQHVTHWNEWAIYFVFGCNDSAV